MTSEERKLLLKQAADALFLAQSLLGELVDSYEREEGERFSACHPRSGIQSTQQQVIRLHNAIARGRV
jgi:hypothetical protein